MVPHYHVSKAGSCWQVSRLDQVAHIGKVNTRREAVQIARMLAGFRGRVTVAGSGRARKASPAAPRRGA
jgi:hypothetical protein